MQVQYKDENIHLYKKIAFRKDAMSPALQGLMTLCISAAKNTSMQKSQIQQLA